MAAAKDKAVTTADVAALTGAPAPAAPKPAGPKFGMCEGTREELARNGTAIDPFTGDKLTRDDLKK
jgi:hypothetical protein